MPSSFLGTLIPVFYLVIFLIVARGRKGDERLTWWIYGWALQSISSLWLLVLLGSSGSPTGRFLVAISHISACICFLMSSPAKRNDRRGTLLTAVGLGVPCIACAALISYRMVAWWMLDTALIIGHTAALGLTVRRFFRQRALWVVLLVFVIDSAWMLVAVRHHDPREALWIIPAELLLMNAAVLWMNHPRKTLGVWVTVFGFLLWVAASPAAAQLLHAVFRAGNMVAAQGALGTGMVLILMEEHLFSARGLAHDFRTIFESAPHMIMAIDPKTHRVVTANPAAAETHGYTVEEFERLTVDDFVAPHIVPDVSEAIATGRPRPRTASLHRHRSGTFFPVNIEARSVQLAGRPLRLVFCADISETEQLLERLQDQAIHDSLTGLLNRAGFHAEAAKLMKKANEYGEIVALLSFNISNFRNVNETYGDIIGDTCLQQIAARIRKRIKADDIAGRTAGDEFKMMVRGLLSSSDAEAFAAAFLQELSAPFLVDGISIRLTINMGLAIAPDDGRDASALRRKALSAMARARSMRLQTPSRYSHEDAEQAHEANRVVEAIREMLQNDSFQVHYQPVCAPDGTLKSMEALLRMPHPQLGMVSPAKFIPIAEDTRLIIPLGQWVFEHVCGQLHTWARQGLPLVPVAVNISALQFRSSDFGSNILHTMESYQIPKNLIYLELTESTVLRNVRETLDAMRSLAASGIRFAIDDFGTGYSSLARLREMPISTLKIDRSFIQKLRPNDTLVEAIISLAHALHMDVIAEGVETQAQLEILRSLQCDAIQGYLLGRPAPAEQAAEILRKGTLTPTV